MIKKSKNRVVIIFIVIGSMCLCACTQNTSAKMDAKPILAEFETEDKTNRGETEKAFLPLSLYIKKSPEQRVKQDTLTATYEVGQDLVVFSAFLTEEAEISGGLFAKVWLSYAEMIEGEDDLKIGYVVSYQLSDGEQIEQTILGPNDTEKNRQYIETYIYDDVHQDGWYSHLTAQDMTDETVLTSLKLTGGSYVDEVRDLTVQAFLYVAGNESIKRGETFVSIHR